MTKDKKKLVPIAFAALLLLALAGFIVSYNLKYKDTSFPQVLLSGESYTGLSRSSADALLKGKIEEAYKEGMKFTYEEKVYSVPLAELGAAIDAEASAEKTFSYGHKADILENIKEQISLLGGSVNLKNEIKGDVSFSGNSWQEIMKLENPARNFTYDFDGKEFIAKGAEKGKVIDKNRLRKDIISNLENLDNREIVIRIIEDKPIIEKDSDQEALNNAKILLEKEIVLKYDSNSWKVPKEDFGAWMDFVPGKKTNGSYNLTLAPDPNHIKDYLLSLVSQINREPVNAQLEFKDGKVNVFSLSQDGISLDAEASSEKIGQEIFQKENYRTAEEISEDPQNDIRIELVTNKVKPELSTDNIDNMGITSLLSTGESNFHGSTKSRRHNIAVGASKFNGILIGPGDEFSFNKILGNVGAKEGYLPELVIKQGQTIAEYGGGLCQVSTTAFRGAVAAGLEVTQRKNHAYAVKYYAPQGTDATIYPPNPDLAFINNTPNYILIQTRISGDYLYFDFYGTNDGRKIKMEGPVVYERGAGGAMKTWWKQQVYDKDGNLSLEKIFYSNYKSPDLYPRTNPLE